jgi:hypothetical protein
VPESLLIEGDPLTRAKNIYKFVQDHYTWNGNFGIYRDIRVKDAFDNKKGNIGEINISLINLLNAANIPTRLMLTSTRDHGLPKKSHPVMSDFNYMVAKTTIEGKDYLLDASDKFVPFGMLPYRSLNYYGRVMDFKNESYWQDITMDDLSKYLVRMQITFDIEEKKAIGIFDEVHLGYDAIARKKLIGENTEEAYLEKMENRVEGDLEISSYRQIEERTNEKMISERFEFELNNLVVDDRVYLDPFLIKFFEKDPFMTEDRQFPIDFGYERNYEYTVNIVLPEEYEADKLPEKKTISLPGNMGLLKFAPAMRGNTVTMHYSLVLNRTHFSSEVYASLKELFKYAVDVQNNSLIVLKRKAS